MDWRLTSLRAAINHGNHGMEGGKEAKRAEIESAMDAIIASSSLPSFPASSVFSGIHDASDRGRPRRAAATFVTRDPSIALFSYANSSSFSFLRSHGEGASGDQLRCRSDSDGVVIMRVARSPALVASGSGCQVSNLLLLPSNKLW